MLNIRLALPMFWMAMALSSCSVNISVEEDVLPGQNPTPDIEFEANLPVINHDSQNNYDLSGTCKESVESFTLEVGSISETVTCVNGEWSVSIDASSLSEGTHTVTTNVTHPTTGDPITFEVTKDTQPPVVSTVTAAGGASLTNQLAVSIAASGTDIAQVYVSEDISCLAGGSWQSLPATASIGSGDGDKLLYMRARDSAGNVSACALIDSGSGHTVTLDQTLPVITGLSDDAVLASSKTWNWGCTDAHTPCEYRYSITQGSAATPTGAFGPSTSGTQSSGDGVYYLNIQAIDGAGNISGTTSVSVTLSTQRPSVTLSSASSNPLNAAFSVTATFSESVTGFIDSDVTITNGAVSGFAGSGDTYTFTVTPTSPGLVTVAIAQNVAQNAISNGNTAASDLTRTFDNVVPTITGLSDDATWTQSKTWNWGCDETCTYRFVVDTTSNATPSGAYGSTTTATQNSGSGTYYLHVQAQDAAGNTSLVHVSALIDNTNPVAPTSVVDGTALSSLTQSPTITFTNGTDANSGINKHQVRVLRSSDDLVIQDWVDFTSGNSVTGLTLTTNTSYYVEVRAVDNVGNISTAGQSDGWIADVTAPTVPTGVSLGAVPNILTESPIVTFTLSGDPSGSGIDVYQAQIRRASDSSLIKDWGPITSGSKITGLSLIHNTQYSVYIRSVDVAGNISASSSGVDWTALDDPCSLSPSPGDVCASGTLYLGSLDSGATSGIGTDKYMTTPGNCGEIPAGARAGSCPGVSCYPTGDFAATCDGGTDSLNKTWNNGTASWYDIPNIANYTTTEGVGNGANNKDLNYGSQNTSAASLISLSGQGGYHAAALYCDKLVYGGYDDWYLPNRYELNLFFINKNNIGGLKTNGDYYWSSSEAANDESWSQRFSDGDQDTYVKKNNAYKVRCVRRIDEAPDNFSIPSINGVPINQYYTTAPQNIVGLEIAVNASVSGDGSPQIRKSSDGGNTWSSYASSIVVASGDQVQIRILIGSTPGQVYSNSIQVGSFNTAWSTVGASSSDVCAEGTASPGDTCSGGTIYLGAIAWGATSTTAGPNDQYMTTPGRCSDVPGGSRGGVCPGPGCFPVTNFIPSCPGGSDNLQKHWNDGSSNWYDVPGVINYTSSRGEGNTNINRDQNYGDYNTSQIIQVFELANGGHHAAARYCDQLVFGGYDDWYLPNRYELNLFNTNKSVIPGLLTGGSWYWSSSESGNGGAWAQRFNNGGQYADHGYKLDTLHVRCVRRF